MIILKLDTTYNTYSTYSTYSTYLSTMYVLYLLDHDRMDAGNVIPTCPRTSCSEAIGASFIVITGHDTTL